MTRTNRKSRRLQKLLLTSVSELVAAVGTANIVIEKAGMKVQRTLKLIEGRPNVVDLLKNKEIQFVINTSQRRGMRRARTRGSRSAPRPFTPGTPIATTLSGAKAAALGIAALKKSGYAVKTIQEYH